MDANYGEPLALFQKMKKPTTFKYSNNFLRKI